MFKFVICLAILAVSLTHVRAKVSKESELALLKHAGEGVDQCAKELNQNAEEIKEQHKSGKVESIDKCFMSCVLKKDGSMNGEGKMDLDKGLETLKGLIKNDDDYKVMEAYAKTCVSVNDVEVSDGAKGCERASLFVACIKKEKQSKQ